MGPTEYTIKQILVSASPYIERYIVSMGDFTLSLFLRFSAKFLSFLIRGITCPVFHLDSLSQSKRKKRSINLTNPAGSLGNHALNLGSMRPHVNVAANVKAAPVWRRCRLCYSAWLTTGYLPVACCPQRCLPPVFTAAKGPLQKVTYAVS